MANVRNLFAIAALLTAQVIWHSHALSATISATARIDSLSIKLIDLDPADGIVPSLFVPASGQVPPNWSQFTGSLPVPVDVSVSQYRYAAVYSKVEGAIPQSQVTNFDNEPPSIPSMSVQATNATKASMSNSAFEAQAESVGRQDSGASAELYLFNSFMYWDPNFPDSPIPSYLNFPAVILSPNTRLEISAQLSTTINLSAECVAQGCGDAWSSASLAIFSNYDTPSAYAANLATSMLHRNGALGNQLSFTDSRFATVSFSSGSESEWISLTIGAFADTRGAAPVPEVHPAVLLILGIPVLVAFARRPTQRA